MTFCGCNKRASAVFDHLHLRTSFIIESSRNYDRPKLQRELENYALSVLSKYLSSKNLETICYTTIEFKIRFDITSYGSRNMTSVSILHKNEIRIVNQLKYRQSFRAFFKRNCILTVYAIYVQNYLFFPHGNKHV